MLPAMSLGNWYRRMFTPTPRSAEDAAVLHEEYGDAGSGEGTLGEAGAPGVSGFAGLESAEAAENAEAATDPPTDPAP
jgi:hypothetical protein